MNTLAHRYITKTLIHAVLIILSIIYLIPFLWMVSTSLKPDYQLITNPPQWIPAEFMWSNYARASRYIPFFRYLGNTFLIALIDVLGTLIACPLVAYGFSRLEWKGRDVLFFITIAVMMIPQEVTMVPQFIMYSKMHLNGTYVPLFLPSFLGGRPFMIFLLRQFFMGLPRDLEDAARIDGAGEFKIYRRIILPLVVPGLLTVGLFRFMYSWNDFLGPLLYITNQNKFTLSLGLQMFTSQYSVEWSLLMAASVMISLPVIVIYFFVQKRFIEGVTFTGIKG